MEENLIKALDNLEKGLVAQTQKDREKAIADVKDMFSAQIENNKKEFDQKVSDMELRWEAAEKRADELDKQIQAKNQESKFVDPIVEGLAKNFQAISNVHKGQGARFMLKAVGDMTLSASLTGDQPRTYNFDPVSAPPQAVNVADIVGSVNIGSGTYTYPRVAKGEGSIGSQTEGQSKSQIDYDYTMVDVNTNFIAGFARFSRKMRNNLPFLQSSLPVELRRDYWIAENSAFNAVLESDATASSQVITGKNKIEMIIKDIAALAGTNFVPNYIAMTPADYFDIAVLEKSTGSGYGLPPGVSFNGMGGMMVYGIPVVMANWMSANKYFVGNFSRVNKVLTEGLSLSFSEEEGSNFISNMITARIESQTALAVEQPAGLLFGDFTAV
jgi:HK97 family phage major capsid protein